MQNWDELDESGQCTSERDLAHVEEICRHIHIPCLRVNFILAGYNYIPVCEGRTILDGVVFEYGGYPLVEFLQLGRSLIVQLQ